MTEAHCDCTSSPTCPATVGMFTGSEWGYKQPAGAPKPNASARSCLPTGRGDQRELGPD
jgi:hypothetical protein